VINVAEMRLYLFPSKTAPGDHVTVRTWAIGIDSEETTSPTGTFTVRSTDANPTWHVPDSIYKTMDPPKRRVVPPGPDNPPGTHRIRLSKGLYSIHGTNTPWSIGRLTTHGCIRLYPEDIVDFYPLVGPGTRGELVYEPISAQCSRGRTSTTT
jgi:L,D-transpeptidase ErfK/SrfK